MLLAGKNEEDLSRENTEKRKQKMVKKKKMKTFVMSNSGSNNKNAQTHKKR